jgi:pyruvate dehydrogenase E1 component alpha subunit
MENYAPIAQGKNMEIKLDVDAVIDHFGGISPLHEKFVAAGVEISRKAIEKWKERDSIPTNGWLQIEELARQNGGLESLRKKVVITAGNMSKIALKGEGDYPKISSKELVGLYKNMLSIRRFEEKAGQLYGMGMIGGFCHLYIGQEAIAVGMKHVMIEGDGVITTYRDHGLMLSCGSDPRSILAELMGRIDGCSKGKGGSMHMFDTKRHFYGGHGIVGAPVPIGTGIAFANKYRGNNNVCMTYFGDGAANQGQVYEAFNMAALWRLPVIYIIENNEYAMGTSVKRSSYTTDLYHRGESMGIPGMQVDGMDIMEVIKAGKEATEYVRSGKGPIILEMKTYRYRGHSMSDPAKYRSKEEVEEMKEHRDPIEGLKKIILEGKHLTEDALKDIEKKIRDDLNEVVEFCKASPEPDYEELWTDVYQ